MAEIPQYKRREAIQPQAQVSGVGEALKGLGQVKGSLFKSIGSHLANTASLQHAQEAGHEAGKNPGRMLLPAFTQSDAEFVKAYKQEEYSTLEFQGNQLLQKLFNDAKLNPSSSSLATFEQNAKNGLLDIISKSTPENESTLKRALMQAYEGNYYTLSNAVYSKNKQMMESQRNVQNDEAVKRITNNQLNGLHDAARADYEHVKADIEKRSKEESWLPERKAKALEVVERAYKEGYYQRKWQEAEEQNPGAGERFIDTLRRNPPEGMTPIQQNEVIQATIQYAGQYKSALAGQQNINYVNAQAMIRSGTMTDLDMIALQTQVNAQQFAQLELMRVKTTGENTRIHREGLGVVENFQNPVYLSNVTDAPRNYAVDKIMIPAAEREKGSPLTLSEQTELLGSFKAPVESLQKRLTAALSAGTPEQKVDAANAVAIAKEQNPMLLKGMSKNEMALADIYRRQANNPKTFTEEGQKAIQDSIYNVSDETLQERQRMVNTHFKDKGFSDQDYLRQATYKALGMKPSEKKRQLPAGLTTVYKNLVRDGIMRTGDIKQAEEEAAFELKNNYGDDGKGKVMYMPPNKIYTDLGYVLENEKMRNLKSIVDENKQIREKGGFVLQELEWEDAPDFSNMFKNPLGGEKLEIKVNGVKREIDIDSDATTQFSPIQDISWAFGYMDENNIFNPLMDPFARYGSYRFNPNKEILMQAENDPEVKMNIARHEKKKMTAYEEEQLKKALQVQAQAKMKKEHGFGRGFVE